MPGPSTPPQRRGAGGAFIKQTLFDKQAAAKNAAQEQKVQEKAETQRVRDQSDRRDQDEKRQRILGGQFRMLHPDDVYKHFIDGVTLEMIIVKHIASGEPAEAGYYDDLAMKFSTARSSPTKLSMFETVVYYCHFKINVYVFIFVLFLDIIAIMYKC